MDRGEGGPLWSEATYVSRMDREIMLAGDFLGPEPPRNTSV